MKKVFSDYLISIETTKVIRVRIDRIIAWYKKACEEPVQDIFISEYRNDDGSRTYENLWLISASYMMEAKKFLSSDNFDIAPYSGGLTYVSVEKVEYDFGDASEKSRLHIEIAFGGSRVTGDFKASASNCEHLRDLYYKYMMKGLQVGTRRLSGSE